MSNEITIRVGKAYKGELPSIWDEVRAVEGLDPEHMLGNPQEVEKFDAATMVEWVVKITEATVPLITAVLGYIVAKRGEVEIDGMKFKNISVSDMKKIVEIIEQKDAKKEKKKSKK